MSKIHIEPKWSDVKPSGEYVYIHYKLDDGLPFYVGKGVGGRGFSASRTAFWKYRAAKHGVRVEICQDGLSTDEAYLLEMWLIAKLRHEGYDLCNMTDGGEGRSGFESEKRREVFCSNGMKFSHAESAAEWLRSIGNPGATSKIVSACALGRKKSIYGYGFSHHDDPPIPVVTGREAQGLSAMHLSIPVYSSDGCSYFSASDAKFILTGKEGSGGHILQACRGERLTAYGLTWSLSPDGPFPEYECPYRRTSIKKWKKVVCENGMKFDAIFLAIEWLELETGRKYTPSAIQMALNRGGRCGGFKWKRLD